MGGELSDETGWLLGPLPLRVRCTCSQMDECPLASLDSSEVKAECAGATSIDPDDDLRSWDAVVLDLVDFDWETRQELIEQFLAATHDRVPIVVRTDDGDAGSARLAASLGAHDVIATGTNADEVRSRILAAARVGRLARADLGNGGPRETDEESDPEIIGSSEPMKQVLRLIRRVARSDVAVLITGESGTGKELAANAIHLRGARRDGPFIAINCGAIPQELLESELFGHERGAFTGATETHVGLTERAHGGTLFLDEIGELPLPLQVKLLRFLQDFVVHRVGGRTERKVDVRVVAATNRDLDELIRSGGFREDLFYRLNVFTLELPPLRDRDEDVLLLARHFLEEELREAGSRVRGFTRGALAALVRAPWPGNVRELRNRIRRAVVLADGPQLTPTDLDLEGDECRSIPTLREARFQAEEEAIRQAMQMTRGNRSESARLLGISRTQLYEILRRHEQEL